MTDPHGPAGQHAARPVDASMSLLNEVMYRPVDPGYEEAAQRPRTRPGATRTAVHLLLAVALGVVTTAAVVQLRTPAPAVSEGRNLLRTQIETRTAEAEELAEQNEAVGEEIAALQAAALESADPELFAELQVSELLAGSVRVAGPGLVLVLEDPDPVDGQEVEPGSRVQDVDLQIVTNALWAAGAEAIAVNGQRLTSLSAIRAAGAAILVDLAPLVPPYEVEAIGDARAMQTAFARSTAANHLTMLRGTYGITSTVRAAERLELPGAGNTTLRHAAVADVASSAQPDAGGTP